MNRSQSYRLQAGSASPGLMKSQKYKETWIWRRARQSWAGELVRASRDCRHELWAWARCQQVVLPNVEQLAKSLEALHMQSSDAAPAEQVTEEPVFLLSTGWRAGSTLLQRILVTDPRLLLWGEPLGEMTIASKLTEMMSHFISPLNLQLWKNQDDPSSADLSISWVANLYPSGSEFRAALRSLFDQWLREAAHKRGFTRWGFKEVRLGAAEASLLHWLYPRAKFVIISRHPYDCYRSLADSNWISVYYRHPDVPVDSAASFAHHWNRLAVSWSELPAGFPSVHIKYEDLITGQVDFRKLESWLGIEIKESVALSKSVGGTAKRSHLNWYERFIIAREAEAGMRALGYSK
jgi:hypothetical protein